MREVRPIDGFYWRVLLGSAAIVAAAGALIALLATTPGLRFLIVFVVALLMAVRFIHRQEGMDIRTHRGGTPSLVGVTVFKLGIAFFISLAITYIAVLVVQVLLFPLFR